MEYSLEEHKHRFAIWTAARAVQRSWTTTANISKVINSVNLIDFAKSIQTKNDESSFDKLHIQVCEQMIEEFCKIYVKATYGRVAKIVAIYLKTYIVIGSTFDNNTIEHIHPPIDRILLRNLPKHQHLDAISKLNWTQLDKAKYLEIVKKIRDTLGFFNWRLEKYWKPEIE
jgi:hypothetical protein